VPLFGTQACRVNFFSGTGYDNHFNRLSFYLSAFNLVPVKSDIISPIGYIRYDPYQEVDLRIILYFLNNLFNWFDFIWFFAICIPELKSYGQIIMNTKEKERIRQIIIEKIDDFKKKIETFKKLSKPVPPDNAIGRITRMEAINSQSINQASLEKSKHRLNRLEKSLKMINDPDFGYCMNCEEPIPYKRLLIMPEAPFCVSCTQKIDQG
jgi:DnaK suppressor protein